MEKGGDIGTQLSEAALEGVIKATGLGSFLKDKRCDREKAPYSPNVLNWNNSKSKIELLILVKMNLVIILGYFFSFLNTCESIGCGSFFVLPQQGGFDERPQYMF